MSKKNRGLSDENLGQVAGGARQYNDDGSMTLSGKDAEIAKRSLAKHDLKRNRKPKPGPAVEVPGAPANSEEPTQGDMINNLFNN